VDYFDPGNPEDMARSILTLLEDTTLRKSLISRGKIRSAEFSWRTTSEHTLSFYQKVMEQ
jgi:glycosyltransferase involved in cell wall biosynthesis